MRTQERSIIPADLGVTRLLRIFAALSVLLLVVLAIAPARSHFSEWRAEQERYNRLAHDKGLAPLPVAVQQIWKPELEAVDRCGSCHVATTGAAAIAGEALYSAHPPIPHEPREFGCVICHGGQGRATTAEAAHDRGGSDGMPLLEKGYSEAGCGSCHSHLRVAAPGLVEKGRALVEQVKCAACHPAGGGKGMGPDLSTIGLHGFRPDWHQHHVERAGGAKDGMWAQIGFSPLADEEVAQVNEYLHAQVGAPRLMAAKTLAYRRGCHGCHKINGVGGDDGPDLSDEGRKRAADQDFGRIAGDHTLGNWLRQHFLDPRKVSPGSVMPVLAANKDEADLLTLYMFSLRSRAIPEAFAPRDRVRGARLGERDFPSDGESLFGVFCAACHGENGQGRKQAEPVYTFPAIENPDFLAVADDNLLRHTLLDGRPGRRMPAWGTKEGGLRPEEVDALVGYLRSREPPPPAWETVNAAPVDLEKGKGLFAANCAPCHGAAGEGSAVAPPLAAKDNPATGDDNRIYGTVENGISGTAMGSFRRLDAPSVRSLIAAVRALPKIDVPRASWKRAAGDAGRGAIGFAKNCARCHGDHGEGKQGPALGNPAFLAAANDGYLTATVLRGRLGTEMPRFGEAAADHAKLSPSEVADIVAHLRTLAPASPQPR